MGIYTCKINGMNIPLAIFFAFKYLNEMEFESVVDS
jgi:hypothetical protein